MKKRLLPLVLALLLLSACGQETAAPTPTPALATPTPAATPTPTPEPTPYAGPVNPLTGLPIEEDWVQKRPAAIMLNNLREALPQQGQSQADIIYEVPAEGGITRMLGIYQDPREAGIIGSIRSSRPYYLELALGHDAIYIHAGGSEDAYAKIKAWGVTALDGVRGPYMSNTAGENLMWRDPERRKHYSLEHTVVTTGETVAAKLDSYESLRRDHKEGYTYEMTFAEDGTPENGSPATTVTVPYSNYKTGVFTYDADSGLYLVEEYGKPYIDGNTGEQVAVANVVVIQTACRNTGDSYGHITVDLSSGGSGIYACGGKMTAITWRKSAPDGQLHYFDAAGKPLVFGQGRTYVNIVPLEAAITCE